MRTSRHSPPRLRPTPPCSRLTLDSAVSVLALLPTAPVLAPLPLAVLAGLVMGAVTSLLDVRTLARYWRWSRPQFAVAGVTAAATLSLAPRIERGVMVGIGMALAVHLWRELTVRVPSRLDGDCLHLWPSGVLYFGSAPALERTLNQLIARHPDLARVVLHLGALGRVDVTGALALRDVIEEAQAGGVAVEIRETSARADQLLSKVLSAAVPVGERSPFARSGRTRQGHRRS